MGAHVRLTRSGGLAGISMVADTDVDDLPPADAARLRDALAGLDFDHPQGGASGPGGGPDRYQYDLEVIDGGRRTLTAHEPGLAPGLQTVVDVLQPLLRPE